MASPASNSTFHIFSNDPNLPDVYLHATLQQINHLANEDVESEWGEWILERKDRSINFHIGTYAIIADFVENSAETFDSMNTALISTPSITRKSPIHDPLHWKRVSHLEL